MKNTFKKHSRAPKLDIYERVTEIVLKRLEEGVAPWQAPSIARVGFPRNFLTKNPYRGINVFLLGSAGYASPWFLTYRQARKLDGQVRKGEKGHLIVKYGTFEKESPTKNAKTDDPETVKRGYLRGYTVFNSSQIDGIAFPEIPHTDYQPSEQVALAQEIIDDMPSPPRLEEGPHACPHYRPSEDLVGMPLRETFTTEERFYTSLFHEFTHATGHPSRLARKTLLENKGMMASGTARQIYAKEELVAEMGAAFLTAHAGIVLDDFENSAAYLSSWLKVLKAKENRRWIVEAASQAQKATEWICAGTDGSATSSMKHYGHNKFFSLSLERSRVNSMTMAKDLSSSLRSCLKQRKWQTAPLAVHYFLVVAVVALLGLFPTDLRSDELMETGKEESQPAHQDGPSLGRSGYREERALLWNDLVNRLKIARADQTNSEAIRKLGKQEVELLKLRLETLKDASRGNGWYSLAGSRAIALSFGKQHIVPDSDPLDTNYAIQQDLENERAMERLVRTRKSMRIQREQELPAEVISFIRERHLAINGSFGEAE